MTINNRTYRGDINGYDVFKAVCVGFMEQPEVCKGENVWEYIQDNTEEGTRKKGLAGLRHLVSAICIILAINVCALYIYRRYSKRKMNEDMQVQVNSAVSQYFRLSGTDPTASGQ